jgi:DNA-binding response OmpR family regulator
VLKVIRGLQNLKLYWMAKIKLLLAEDEIALGQIIKESLETRNFEVIYCKNGQEAFESYQSNQPDLIILDVMMPVLDGFSVAKKIRGLDMRTPIIFLTAKSQTQDVVDGFEHGGNDYLKKPFSMEELLVRIKALLDRVQVFRADEDIELGQYRFNRHRQTLKINDSVQALTYRESQLLFHLSEKRNNLLDRMIILKKLWGEDDFFTARSMDVFISRLRKKLKKDPNIKIVNIRGQGYKLLC